MEQKLIYAAVRLLLLLTQKRTWILPSNFKTGGHDYSNECNLLKDLNLVRVRHKKKEAIIKITSKGHRALRGLRPKKQRVNFVIMVWDEYLAYLRNGKVGPQLEEAGNTFKSLLERESQILKKKVEDKT